MCSNLRKLRVFPCHKTSLLNLLLCLIYYLCHPLLATEIPSYLSSATQHDGVKKVQYLYIHHMFPSNVASPSTLRERVRRLWREGEKQTLHKRKHFLKIQMWPNLISNPCLHLQLWGEKKVKMQFSKTKLFDRGILTSSPLVLGLVLSPFHLCLWVSSFW